ncbi:O-antigen ligase family protein [Nocardioides sp. TF02-7]|uniref:O-antigen ligase family protein n=1 Tax=Nocardioides sp. TF02-7 TaxID=2917724 RepID=UPI001F06A839|nr:O-antigen ligase family protein [Nocardioides sp. TF02-7]UMG91117.1 hypothetical protein MF408_13000 [Nocardioides sp. TF02-7]
MERGVVTAALAAVAAALAFVATRGLVAAVAALVVAVGVFLLAVLGRERVGTLAIAGAFATAPMYRGLLPDLPATPTDLLLVVGVVLLLPELFTRQVRLPAAFLVALGVLLALGLRGAAANPSPFESILILTLWLMCIGMLPIVIALWGPGPGVVQFLLWSYLAGHMASIAYALLEGPLIINRYDGLTHHPNAFGIAGTVCIAIFLYLWPKYRNNWARAALLLVVLASGASVLMSGSRAATVVVVALALLVPAVERSAVLAMLLAAAAGLGVAFLPFVVEASGEGSSISRLLGDATAQASDSVRQDALDEGQRLFSEAPFLGHGLTIALGEIHNLYLEVVIAVGILGGVAYLVLLYVLARPLLSSHPERRLAYLAWVFVIIGPAVPGLTDRTMLLPMGLAILPAIALATRGDTDSGARAPGPPATAGTAR